ncbi:MAG: ClpXP protease specificity-enhancing factor SspB [Pseudomonadota bacterium]
MSSDDAEFDYAYLAQNALRGVVRDVLGVTADLGHPPGEHHFYIEFVTTAPGVRISDSLRAEYPERMTIVLQHQFTDLDAYPDRFEVTLHFKGIPDRLIIPYEAVTQFADPSVNFALQFPVEDTVHQTPPYPTSVDTGSGDIETLDAHRPKTEKSDTEDDGPDDEGPGPGGSADVVSIDRFRKK